MAQRNGWVSHALSSHEKSLVRYARRLTGNLDAARDIVQETFLRLCRQSPGQLDGHLKEWLFTVCRNSAFDHLRKEGRMDTLDKDVAVEQAPLETLEERETQDQVAARIEALPAKQREMVHLKFVEGLSYKQISSITGASVSNVGFILHTAIKTLREQLSPARSD